MTRFTDIVIISSNEQGKIKTVKYKFHEFIWNQELSSKLYIFFFSFLNRDITYKITYNHNKWLTLVHYQKLTHNYTEKNLKKEKSFHLEIHAFHQNSDFPNIFN